MNLGRIRPYLKILRFDSWQGWLFIFLFGSILSIGVVDVVTIGVVSIVILVWVVAQRKELIFSSIDKDGAYVHDRNGCSGHL